VALTAALTVVAAVQSAFSAEIAVVVMVMPVVAIYFLVMMPYYII
jgi:hypothetical protein